MTARQAIGGGADRVRRRLDEVLDSEDAVIVLVDRTGATSYYHGFAASGCQLELIGHELDAALRPLAMRASGGAGDSEVSPAREQRSVIA